MGVWAAGMNVDFYRDGIPVTSLRDRREYLAVQLMVDGGALHESAVLQRADGIEGETVEVGNGDWLIWRENTNDVMAVRKVEFDLLFKTDPARICPRCNHPCHNPVVWGHRHARCARFRFAADPISGRQTKHVCWCAPCRCKKCA